MCGVVVIVGHDAEVGLVPRERSVADDADQLGGNWASIMRQRGFEVGIAKGPSQIILRKGTQSEW